MVGALKQKNGWLAALTAGLLLFAQIAIAAQACMLAQAPSAPQQAMSEAGCDGMPLDAAECAARCGEQLQGPAPDHCLHADHVAAANYFRPFALPAVRETSRWIPRYSAGTSGPPLQVLYCTYQL